MIYNSKIYEHFVRITEVTSKRGRLNYDITYKWKT